jgi:NAD(P)-dependent dehydrogenase (short-subunit alcohol dehydrogenase family)
MDPKTQLAGQVAVVTGAGQGIGAAVARRLAGAGSKVVVAELDPSAGRRTVEQITNAGGEAILVATDVGIEEQARNSVEAAVEQWGRIDTLVNNAWGGGSISRLEWKQTTEMERAWRVGFMSGFWTMQAAFPHMKRQHLAGASADGVPVEPGSTQAKGGSIINVCSLNGVNAHVFSVEYNTAKEALRTLTRTAAVEWGRHQIRANAICPAAATDAYVDFRDKNPETAQEMLKENPMRRMGDPDADIAGVVLWLASADMSYVNGNTIFLDGGAHVNGVTWRPDMPEDLPVATESEMH